MVIGAARRAREPAIIVKEVLSSDGHAAMSDRLPDHVRVSDQERADAVERLGAHAVAGRLTVAELEQRVGLAHEAVYARDLRALERDLPGPPPGRWRAMTRHARPVALGALVVAAVAVVATVHPIVPLVILAVIVRRRLHYAGRSTRASAS